MVGSKCGALLPTGAVQEEIDGVPVSCIVNRLLSSCVSTDDKIVELSRGVMRASRYGESNGSGGIDGVNSLRPMADRCQDDPMNHGFARGCACVPWPSRQCLPEPGAASTAAL